MPVASFSNRRGCPLDPAVISGPNNVAGAERIDCAGYTDDLGNVREKSTRGVVSGNYRRDLNTEKFGHAAPARMAAEKWRLV